MTQALAKGGGKKSDTGVVALVIRHLTLITVRVLFFFFNMYLTVLCYKNEWSLGDEFLSCSFSLGVLIHHFKFFRTKR